MPSLHQEKFLFKNERKSYPVVEFQSSGDESMNIPSFILETTWPRVLYFYHPFQAKFDYFQDQFVQIARHIRLESDILVLFYAISCAAHPTMCSNSDVILHQGRPLLKSYKSGSTIGTEILISDQGNKMSIDDSIEKMNSFVDQLVQAMLLEEIPPLKRTEVHLDDHGTGEITNEKLLEDIFNDALTAFILTIRYNIYGDLSTIRVHDNEGASTQLPQMKADILKDFLDLCYWTLPSKWIMVQGLLHDLRSDFAVIIGGPHILKSLLSKHSGIETVAWSDGCKAKSNKDVDSNGINLTSYSCGLWKLFHIISVGVNEAHHKVLGDVRRATPAYAAWVLRDFISEFIPEKRDIKEGAITGLPWCKGCKDRVINLYDSCKYEEICISRITFSEKRIPQGENWQKVAEWMWTSHNEGNKSSWPSKQKCPNCVRAGFLGRKFVDFTDSKIYDILKWEYWPSEFHNVRLAVLKKFTRELSPLPVHGVTRSYSSRSKRPVPLMLSIMLITTLLIIAFRHKLKLFLISTKTRKRK